MRIGIIGPIARDSRAENLLLCLKEMGHEGVFLGSVSPIDGSATKLIVADLLTRSLTIEAAAQRRLVQRAKELEPDLILSIDKRLLPATVAELKKSSKRVCLWYFDALTNMGRSLMFLAPYDVLFVKERWLLDRCQSLLDLPVHYLPEGFNPMWTEPLSDEPASEEVVIAGTLYPFRARLLERLIRAGLPISIYGPPIPRWISSPELEARHTRKYVSRRDRAMTFRTAGCVLNTFHPSEIEGVNGRFFQSTGAGAALLTEARSDVFRHYTDDEVMSYSNFDELVSAAKHLLHNPTEARQRGDAAAKRARAEHTYQRRLETVFEAADL